MNCWTRSSIWNWPPSSKIAAWANAQYRLAKLALAIILQAYTGVSDEEVVEALVMDRRWQLVLDCLDCKQAPFGKGTLVRFRAALIAK